MVQVAVESWNIEQAFREAVWRIQLAGYLIYQPKYLAQVFASKACNKFSNVNYPNFLNYYYTEEREALALGGYKKKKKKI